ncbi:uncharacterized protein LOC111703045 isoform X2 [Eurytemora carolleeae]|uniref:uncharacterized protein LOC111703045 isoform X2 n=1 Tax=Eurytemora carolleeae TaxID=1294199 RepID=UPI000C78DC0D|nr:uncharacterized protein LOC111703045 isoform X2 [Eurytemora carolleeae]|eukprot:XP_023330662.1 uncharacterized protein LOC111703045 isoform X2 [Eurytemora affinis]
MLLKDYVGRRWVDQKWFVKINLGIQIYLLLTGIGCCLVSSLLMNRSDQEQNSCNQTQISENGTSSIQVQRGAEFEPSAVSLMVYGVMQTIPSILCLGVHMLYGYIARTAFILVHLLGTIIQIISGSVALVSTGLIIPLITNCSEPSSLGFTQGLTVLVVVLVISILLHIIIITLLLTVDFISIIKDSDPPKIRLDSYRSPAMYMSRGELQEIKDSTDLLKLHHVLRTRLPSLKSNHPTHPASPGFLNSLADVPLSPYLKDPSLGAGFFLATGETKLA